MEAVMQVIELPDGHYAVRTLGGNALSTTSGAFATKAEAEEAMMCRTLFPRAGSGIMRPGDGSNVA